MIDREPAPADWQLPRGVNRALWDYLNDAELAGSYEQSLAHSPLTDVDVAFCVKHFSPPGRLVDLGCGTGRLLRHFSSNGYWCVGIDLSSHMLQVAAERAREAGTRAEFVRANLAELDALSADSFDYAACLFSTFGMIMGADNRRNALAHFHRILRPGGCLVLHAHNRWFNIWSSNGRKWLAKDLVRRMQGNLTAGDYVMPTHQAVAGLTLHLFTRRELRRAVVHAGFHIKEIMPVGIDAGGRLPRPWWFTGLRAYGYLIAASKQKTAPTKELY